MPSPTLFLGLPPGRPILLWPKDNPGLTFALGRTGMLVGEGIRELRAMPGGDPDVLEPREDRFFCANAAPEMPVPDADNPVAGGPDERFCPILEL